MLIRTKATKKAHGTHQRPRLACIVQQELAFPFLFPVFDGVALDVAAHLWVVLPLRNEIHLLPFLEFYVAPPAFLRRVLIIWDVVHHGIVFIASGGVAFPIEAGVADLPQEVLHKYLPGIAQHHVRQRKQ